MAGPSVSVVVENNPTLAVTVTLRLLVLQFEICMHIVRSTPYLERCEPTDGAKRTLTAALCASLDYSPSLTNICACLSRTNELPLTNILGRPLTVKRESKKGNGREEGPN